MGWIAALATLHRRNWMRAAAVAALVSIAASGGLAAVARAATTTPLATAYCVLDSPNLSLNLTRVSPDRNGKLQTSTAVGDDSPLAVAVDDKGVICVANQNTRTVTVFAKGSNGAAPPIATIGGPDTGLVDPYGIGVDSNGRIYVLNTVCGTNNNCTPSVLIFKASSNGDAVPVARINPPTSLYGPQQGIAGMAVDGKGDVFLTGISNSLHGSYLAIFHAFAGGNPALALIIHGSNTELENTGAVAVDTAGNVYVAEVIVVPPLFGVPQGGGAILEFSAAAVAGTNSNVAPIAAIFGDLTTLDDVGFLQGVALDASGNIYARSSAGTSVFAPQSDGNVAPVSVINTNGDTSGQPPPLTVDADGNVYTAYQSNRNYLSYETDVNSIGVFAAGSSGNISPMALITRPLIGSDAAAAVDKQGNVYVSGELGSAVIEEFAAGSTDSAPINSIALQGDAAVNPGRFTLGPDGSIYLNTYSSGLFVYPPGSTGDAAPVRHLDQVVPSGNGGWVSDMAVDAANDLYLLEIVDTGAAGDSMAVLVYPADANGTDQPSAVISGPHTLLSGANGIAIDSAGNLLVSAVNYPSSTGPSRPLGTISKYPLGSNGDVAPKIVVSSASGLVGVRIDSAGRFYSLTPITTSNTAEVQHELAVFSPTGTRLSATPLPFEGDGTGYLVAVSP